MALTAKEREVRGFIRPPGVHAHSLVPHRVVHVQDALDPQAWRIFRRIVEYGRKISNPKYTLREMSHQEVGAAEGVSHHVVERCVNQLLERKFLQLEPSIHGDVGLHRPRGLRTGEKRRKSVYRVLCEDYKEWLRDEGKFPLYNGRHLVLGSEGRVGDMFTAEMFQAWHIGDEQGGLKAAADAGAAIKAAAGGDVIAAAGPPVEMPARLPEKLEFPPVRTDVSGLARDIVAAVHAITGGVKPERCWQYVDFMNAEAGAELSTDELVGCLVKAGLRIREAKKKRAIANVGAYLLQTLRSVIAESPPGTGPPVSQFELPHHLRPLLALNSEERAGFLRSLGYPQHERAHLEVLKRVLSAEEWQNLFDSAAQAS